MSHDAHNPTSGAPGSRDPRQMLDAYLDGMLEAADAAAFEKALADDPALRAEVEAQRSIDTSLSRLFHREAPISFAGPIPDEPTVSATTQLKLVGTEATPAPPELKKAWFAKSISPWSAVAAVLVFATIAGLYLGGVIDPDKWIRGGESLVAANDVYKRKVENGFEPDWVCETDEQFIKNTTDMFNEPLLIRSTDAVKIVGWSYYEPVLSKSTAILLTVVDGKEVIVVMDKKENDRKLRLPKSSGLNEFSQVIGNAVLHEITPFDSARVLPLVERK